MAEGKASRIVSVRLTGGLDELVDNAAAEEDYTDLSSWIRAAMWDKVRKARDNAMEKRLAESFERLRLQQSQLMNGLSALFSLVLTVAKASPDFQSEQEAYESAIELFNKHRNAEQSIPGPKPKRGRSNGETAAEPAEAEPQRPSVTPARLIAFD